MNITMTIEVTPEQAVRIAEILKEPANTPVKPITSVPVQQAAQPPAVPSASAVPVQAPIAPAPVLPVMPSTIPAQQPLSAAPPVSPAPTMTAPPTTVKKYTMDELSLASRPIVEAGRQQELLNLLHSFTYTDQNGNVKNVQTIRDLPDDLYPAFANGIRQLGGRI